VNGAQSHFHVNQIFQVDPTRTTGLRSRFLAQMNKRWRVIRRDMRTSIVDNDCFGIQDDRLVVFTPTRSREFAFTRTADKVRGFSAWLEAQEKLGVLEIIQRPGHLGIESAWSDVYIETAYQKGMRRARSELRRKGYQIPTFESVPGGISAVMNGPVHADRVGVLFSRTFEDLKSVTQVTNAQVRRRIADGLTTGLSRGIAEGKNPRLIARELFADTANRIDKIGMVRSRMIARTEIIRAHTSGLVQEYREADADLEVVVKAEWSTAGYGVCAICADYEAGGPYTLDWIDLNMPAHPNCRCVPIPVLNPAKGKAA
jgi:hypothetical protein